MILLLWYKDEVFAIENRSPADSAYSEGLPNAKLTQETFLLEFFARKLFISFENFAFSRLLILRLS